MPELVLDYRYDTGNPDLDATAPEVRRQADEHAATVTARTSEVAGQLVARGLSVRDVAALLGISPQRAFLSSRRTPADLATREPQSCLGRGY